MIRTAICSVFVLLSGLVLAPSASADNYLTQSGRVMCAVTPDSTIDLYGPDAVACQGDFVQAPANGYGAVVNQDGALSWVQGNLAVDNPTTRMSWGQTYRRGNWTILSEERGTTFTHNLTGHGMFVSIENVYAF